MFLSRQAVNEGEDIGRVFLNGLSFYPCHHFALSALLLLLYKAESLTIGAAKSGYFLHLRLRKRLSKFTQSADRKGLESEEEEEEEEEVEGESGV